MKMRSEKGLENFIDNAALTLEEWLSLLNNPPKGVAFISYMFPTPELAKEYLSTVNERSYKEVQKLLLNFLLPSTSLGADKTNLEFLMHFRTADPQHYEHLRTLTYYQRLPAGFIGHGAPPPWEGNTWVLDLLPDYPQKAIDVIASYITAHIQLMPDGRVTGHSDAADVIRVKYIGLPGTTGEMISYLHNLSDRDFEHITERLYKAMGYKTLLTPPKGDGGRDVIADKTEAGRKEKLAVECKLHNKPVGVEYIRRLQGVVSIQRFNKGVLVTNNRFTRGAKREAEADTRLETIAGEQLVVLLNQYLGSDWYLRTEYLIQRSRQSAE